MLKLSKKRYYDMAILISIIASAVLLCLRYALTARFGQGYLVWNMFLALLPYVIARLAGFIYDKYMEQEKSSVPRKKFFVIVAFLLWLLMFPNASYIITDFIHVVTKAWLGTRQAEWLSEYYLMWFDIIFNASIAFIWHLVGIVSMYMIVSILKKVFNKKIALALVGFASFASGFAIYIGRFDRLNSWNLIIHPVRVVNAFASALSKPFSLLFSLSCAFFIAVSFAIFCLLRGNEDKSSLSK